MNKPLLSKISMITIFLIGWLIMTYPFYVNAVNFFIDSYRSSQYEKELQAKYEQELAKWEAKNQQIAQQGLHPGSDPFEENSSNKAEQKMLKHHYLGKINIPKLALEIPLFDSTTPYLLEQGATVLDGTSVPIGGENTHSVITAHRGLPQRELFTNLPKLVEQDIFLIEIAGSTQAYQVIDSQIVTPEDTSVLSI
ncbi:class C sortase [Enterococcus saccharolyticus]|nr:class C sortase [Enterococcus saccharolyticus]